VRHFHYYCCHELFFCCLFPLSEFNAFIFLGCGYFWVIIDLLHTLTFEGAELIPGLQLSGTFNFGLLLAI
jgi:hypothetical protein